MLPQYLQLQRYYPQARSTLHCHKPSRTRAQAVLSRAHGVGKGKRNWLVNHVSSPGPLSPFPEAPLPCRGRLGCNWCLRLWMGRPQCAPQPSPGGQEGFVGMAASASRGWGRALPAGGDGSWWTEGEGGLCIPRWMGLGVLLAGRRRRKCKRTGESTASVLLLNQTHCPSNSLICFRRNTNTGFLLRLPLQNYAALFIVLPELTVVGSIPRGQLSICTLLELTGQL